MATAETNDLITEVTQLPVQPGAAMRLLWMLEDPRTSAADLGRLIESDPALSTQVIRLSNTAFYGLSGKVSSAWRAVTVLGLATVRAIATTAAFDLFSEKGRSVPDEFWEHSVTTAAAAAAIARRVGVQPNDAFSAGLLHDLGTALVFRRAPRRYDTMIERRVADPDTPLVDIELEEFGATHAEVGAAALGVMRFPAEMVEAIAGTPHARRVSSRPCSAACSSPPTRSHSRSTVSSPRRTRRSARRSRRSTFRRARPKAWSTRCAAIRRTSPASSRCADRSSQPAQ